MMRHKFLVGGAAVTACFLLATNPVVVNAAATITGADIKNGSLTGKDVKNGSLKSGDFKAGQIPAGPTGPAGPAGPIGPQGPAGPVKIISSFPVASFPAGVYSFSNTTVPTVTVTVGQRLMGSVTASLVVTAATTARYSLCTQLGVGALVPFGTSNDYHVAPLDGTARINTVSAVSGALTAGTYKVGFCVLPTAAATIAGDPWHTGFIEVLPAGTASKPATSGARG